ncbi:hypothetical protein Ancab_029929 [Ancistrocladus abbreviatus]
MQLQTCSFLEKEEALSSTHSMTLSINNPIHVRRSGGFCGGGRVGGGAGAVLSLSSNPTTNTLLSLHPHPSSPSLSLSSRTCHIAAASSNKSTPRIGKFDGKKRRSSFTTIKEQEDPFQSTYGETKNVGIEVAGDFVDDGFVMPELPGSEPDFWEGPKWDALGFFVQYLWAFGIVFALIGCGIAVATYNEGATDFKETPTYKESVQSRDLLEGPEASNLDVFESNPTEEAPHLE